ncbi:protein of unknown function [Nitrospira japonica]|uniref:Histidine kinase n=1 Tax=Nitrospira japonica TaxID=1325564 RepID=A0A1W1I2X6_9BACT|nr:response regulator [Nitrospira japonica]SLM47358.1 protein of unknown function [Nitrospira japonica]
MPKGNILIVEDEAVVAADLAGKLERAGYRVVGIAADGEDALETAAAQLPDLVLMDIRLAGQMDGIETAERIREARSIPVIYLTAHSDASTLQRASMTEPFGYILKPFDERDITTQIEIVLYKHEAEKSLRESEERYRTLVETATDGIITLDAAGVILSCNAATERMFGYRREDLLGRKVTMLIPAWFERREPEPDRIDSRRAPRDGLRRDVTGQRRQGAEFPLEVAVSRSSIAGEACYMGILRDVSERKRAEAELRWRADLLEQTHEAVIVWRMGGGILYWNRGATELYGWTVAEATGRSVHRLLESALPCPPADFDRRLLEAGHWYGEVRQRTKDGRTVVVETRMVPIPDGPEDVLVLEANRDVTDRHTIHEKVCRLAEELEQRVAERTRELVTSQDLLRALASELTVTEQRERRRVATELHDYLAQLLVCAHLKVSQARPKQGNSETEGWLDQAAEVLQQALSYTRSLVAQLTPMVLHEFGLPSAIRWLAEQMHKHQLTVDVEIQAADPLPLAEDEAILLFQSVRELLINVSKHARVDRATVRLTVAEGILRIEVRDEGKGLDSAGQEPSKDDSTELEQSARFGLFSIQERMKALGGWFTIASTPETGTVAAITLPLRERTEPHDRDAWIEHPDSGPETILRRSPETDRAAADPLQTRSPVRPPIRVLLVDDHALMRQGLKGLLEDGTDMTVVGEAADGEEALAIAETLRPEVVIMDINMPKMDGVEATRRLKKRLPSTVVIGLSMHTSAHHRDALKDAGAFAYLTKGSVSDQLKQTILAASLGQRPTPGTESPMPADEVSPSQPASQTFPHAE